MTALSRAFTADLEIRSDGDGRTIQGIVVPYGQTARVSDGGPSYEERFQRGAFTKFLNERPIDRFPLRLLSQHDSNRPLGRAIELRDTESGMYGAFRISNTAEGNDQLELVRDGVLGAFSVGFRPINQKRDGSVTVRTEAALREVSLVTFPAYEGALVTGMRALTTDEHALAMELLAVLAAADSRLDPIVESLLMADGALDAAQAVIAKILAVPNPDEPGEEEEHEEMGIMQMLNPESETEDEDEMVTMSSSLTSLARRLDEALAARATSTPTGAGTDGPQMHPGRLIIARNVLRASLIERRIT